MYKSIEHQDGLFLVHVAESGLSATKGITHGRVVFDPEARTVQFSRHPAVFMPDFDKVVSEGAVISFGLVGIDGNKREQRRDVLVQKNKDGGLYGPGISKTPSNHPKAEGWRIRVQKFRAYFTHPGVETETEIAPHRVDLPGWLKDSIDRQRRFRNRMVKLCNDARHACRPVDYEAFLTFLRETVFPELEAFNNSLGRSKEKISAEKLRRENPSIFHLTRFGGYLKYLAGEGKPVPEGLAQKIFDFANTVKLDFAPINEFQRNLTAIMRQERYLQERTFVTAQRKDGTPYQKPVYRTLTDPAEIEARRAELELRDWEWKPVAVGFAAALKRRRTMGHSFFEGWPRFTPEDSTEWGIHYYFNGGVDASLLTGKGVRALTLQPEITPATTGRTWKPTGRRATHRQLHPAQISFRDTLSGSQFSFRFAVLRHEFPIPEGAFIKEWKLINNRSGLWLCLVVEGIYAKPVLHSGEMGAVHIGWRKEGSEISPAMVYSVDSEGREAFHRIVVDEELRPEETNHHTRFRLNMGASRQGRRSPYWISAKEPHQRVAPGTAGAIQVQDTWHGIRLAGKWRDGRKDQFKSLLAGALDPAPAGLKKAGARTLHQIGAELTDPALVKAYQAWAREDREIEELIATFSARVTARLSNGYSVLAHDICKSFEERGITSFAIQERMLAKVAKRKKSRPDASEAEEKILEASQKNRQHAAPGQLMQKLVNIADQYGIEVVLVDNAFISRKHSDPGCNHLNPPSADRLITCEKCGRIYDQDENAARNMVEAARSALAQAEGDEEIESLEDE